MGKKEHLELTTYFQDLQKKFTSKVESLNNMFDVLFREISFDYVDYQLAGFTGNLLFFFFLQREQNQTC